MTRFLFNPFTVNLDIAGVAGSGIGISTETGNDSVAVGPTVAGNINVVGNNSLGVNITGNAASNTLTVAGIAASTSQVGVQANATNAQASGQSASNVSLTPSNITSFFSTTPLPVSQGGTGAQTFNAYGVLVAGTTPTGQFESVTSTGTSGQVLTSNGALALPSWSTPSSTPQTPKIIVNAAGGTGVYTTLATGMAAASAGDTILVMPGTYTENVTIIPGVNIYAYPALNPSNENGPVILKGTLTLSSAGNSTIYGLQLQTNAAAALTVSNASAVLTVINCMLYASNHSFISMSSGALELFDCYGWMSGGSPWAITGGTLTVFGCQLDGDGPAGNQATCTSNGVLNIYHSNIGNPISQTSNITPNTLILNSNFNTNSLAAITVGSTSGNIIDGCYISSSNQAALSVGSGATATITRCTINSSATNVITGSGTVNYGNINFTGSGSGVNTTTANPYAVPVAQGGTGLTTIGNSKVLATNSSGTLAARALSINVQTFTSGTPTYTPSTGMLYCTIEAVGGGGGGAGCPASGASTVSCGGGGGGGAYVRKTFSAATIGASQSITIGTGGVGGTGNAAGTTGNSTTVGGLLTAAAGSGGNNAGAASPAQASGGAGGAASGGDVNVNGGGGGSGFGINGAVMAGWGGGSYFAGPTAQSGTTSGAAQSNGNAGQNYGGGGGGAYSQQSGTAANGGAGAGGVVIVTEYIIN